MREQQSASTLTTKERPTSSVSTRSGRPSSSRSSAFVRPQGPSVDSLEAKAAEEAALLKAELRAEFKAHALEWKRQTGLRVVRENDAKRETDGDAALHRIHEICTAPATLCQPSVRRELATLEQAVQVPGPSTGTGGHVVSFKRWPGTSHLVREYNGHLDKAVLSCAVSEDGRYLVTASEDNTLKLWGVRTGEELHTFQRDEEQQCYGHMRAVLDCAVKFVAGIGQEPAPDIMVLSCSQDMSMKAWVVNQPHRSVRLDIGDPGGAVLRCSFSPNGKLMLSCGDDGSFSIASARSGALRRRVQAHKDAVHACAFSPDMHFVVTCGGMVDPRIHLWNMAALLPKKGEEAAATLTGGNLEIFIAAMLTNVVDFVGFGDGINDDAEELALRIFTSKMEGCITAIEVWCELKARRLESASQMQRLYRGHYERKQGVVAMHKERRREAIMVIQRARRRRSGLPAYESPKVKKVRRSKSQRRRSSRRVAISVAALERATGGAVTAEDAIVMGSPSHSPRRDASLPGIAGAHSFDPAKRVLPDVVKLRGIFDRFERGDGYVDVEQMPDACRAAGMNASDEKFGRLLARLVRDVEAERARARERAGATKLPRAAASTSSVGFKAFKNFVQKWNPFPSRNPARWHTVGCGSVKPSTAERMLLRANLLAKRKLERVKLEMIATLQSEAGKALFEQQVSMAATAMAFEKSEAAGKVAQLDEHEMEITRTKTLRSIIQHCGTEVLPHAQKSFLDQRALPARPGEYHTTGADAPAWRHGRQKGRGGSSSGRGSPRSGSGSPERSRSASPVRGGRGSSSRSAQQGGRGSPTSGEHRVAHAGLNDGDDLVLQYLQREGDVWRPLDHDGATAVLLDPTNPELSGLDLAKPQVESSFIVRTFEVTGPKGWRRLGHRGAINDVCFSPEGVYVISCSSDKTLKVWATYTGVLLRTLQGHTDAVTSCAFAPVRAASDKGQHRRVASASADRTLRVWDILSGEVLALLRGHSDVVTKVVWTPDGVNLFSCSRDASVRLWQVVPSRPSPPPKLSLTDPNTDDKTHLSSLLLHWHAPIAHGRPILGYRIERRERPRERRGDALQAPTPHPFVVDADVGPGEEGAGIGHELRHIVRRLRSGVKQEVRVAAINECGMSDWSDTVAFMTPPSTPSTVGYLHVAKSQKNSVTLQWSMPAANGAPIHTVSIQCKGGKLAPQFGEGRLGQAIVVESRLVLAKGAEAYAAGVWRGDKPDKNRAKRDAEKRKARRAASSGGGARRKRRGAGAGKSALDDEDQAKLAARCVEWTMENLEAGTDYQFRVAATNHVGLSPWSEHSRTASTFSSKSLPPSQPHVDFAASRVEADGVVASTSADCVTIAWSPPLSDGGAVVTRYRITWVDAYPKRASDVATAQLGLRGFGAFVELDPRTDASPEAAAGSLNNRALYETADLDDDGPERSAAIVGLRPATPYHFSVSAFNMHGWSEESPISGVITTACAVPSWSVEEDGRSSPTLSPAHRTPAGGPPPVAFLPTPTSLRLRWVLPRHNGSALREYLVQWREAGTGDVFTDDATVSALHPLLLRSPDGFVEWVVEGLFADAKYEFVVAARNGVGLGPLSATSVAIGTLPPKPPLAPAAPQVTEPTLTSCCVAWTCPVASGAMVYEFHVYAAPCNAAGALLDDEATTPLALVAAGEAAQTARAQAQAAIVAFDGEKCGAASSTVCDEGCECVSFVEGAKPGVTYRFSIVAINEAGQSPRSAQSTPVRIPTITEFIELEKQRKRQDTQARRERRMSRAPGS